MKRYLIKVFMLIFSLLVVSLPAFSQGTQDSPRLVLKEREFDAGKVLEGEIIRHDFVILNDGNAALKINRVSPG